MEVNFKNPLLAGFWWWDSEGEEKWATIKYERLSDFCYGCGCLGHTTQACREEVVTSEEDKEKPRYGPWTAGVKPKPLRSRKICGGSKRGEA